MYKLTYFKAKHVIGFLSGIGTNTFELDLKKFNHKDILVIFGDNASGKSTFLSLVHPWPTPSDGREKFIVPGKEGVLLREYTSDNGNIITTKCVYHPKNDDSGHSVKCFLSIKKNADKDEVELNPSGNVTSYKALLYTYFGINKEFLSFANYNNEVANIISMTDGERKNSVGSLVPNMGRFEVAYNTVNEKYKELRSLIRNVSDKITHMRDEESLRADLARIDKEVDLYVHQREDQIKKMAKIDGRLKELTKGEDSESMVAAYHNMVQSAESNGDTCERIKRQLHRLYDELGLEYESSSVNLRDGSSIPNKILKYERKIATTEAELANYQERQQQYISQLSDIENQILELETTIFAAQDHDIGELLALKESYESQLKQLKYHGTDKTYQNMSYDEVIAFSSSVSSVHNFIQAMYDEYGELVADYFKQIHDKGYEEKQIDSLNTIQARIETNSAKRDAIYRKLIEMEQYRKFQAILDQRPKSCTIDSCPFIANALKWEAMSDEVERLKAEYEDIGVQISDDIVDTEDHEKRLAIYNHAQLLINQLNGMAPLIQKYFGINLDIVYQSIVDANWTLVLDILKLKEIASILSEKDLYQQITEKLIPEVNHNIEIAKMYETNRKLITSQIDRLKEERKELKRKTSEFNMHVAINATMVSKWREKASQWRQIQELLEQYQESARVYLELSKQITETESEIVQIQELKEKRKQLKASIEELTKLADDRIPVQRQLQMNLVQLDQLHMEKLEIERDFIVIDVIRSIIQPGKGIRKELINIYMYDIYQTANQLLLHTFNGNLYLKEFIITDKEFIIPYVYNGTESPDIALASASQKSAIAISISMAILSKIMGDYGIACFDEADGPFSPANRSIFIDILTTQIRYIGLKQCFFITQHQNEYTESDSVGFIAFPGGNTKHISEEDLIVVK